MLIFALGTLWFWILVAATCIFTLVAVANEWPGRATLSLLVFALCLHFFGDISVISWVIANPVSVLALVAGYLAVGAGWSLVKWYFFMRRVGRAYIEAKLDFLREGAHEYRNGYNNLFEAIDNPNASTPIPEAVRERWLGSHFYVNEKSWRVRDLIEVDMADHRHRIMIWIGYWPFSAAWTLVDDPLRAAVRALYDHLADVFAAIAKRVTAKLNIAVDTAPAPSKLAK